MLITAMTKITHMIMHMDTTMAETAMKDIVTLRP